MHYNGVMRYNAGDDTVIAIVMIYLVFIGVMLIGALADYVIRGIGMYKMGKAQGRTNSWLSFIPYARTYFQGELSGDVPLKKKSIKNPGVWMIVVPIVYGAVIGVVYFIFWIMFAASVFSATNSMQYYDGGQNVPAGMIGMMITFLILFIIVTIAFTTFTKVLRILVNRQIYNRYTVSNMAILHAVLGTMIPLYESIALFIFGRRAEQEREEQYTPRSEETQNFENSTIE